MTMANTPLHCEEQHPGDNTFGRNSMRLTTFLITPLCFALAALNGLAQASNQNQPGSSCNGERQLAVPLVPRIFQHDDKSANTKSDSPWFKGKARFVTLHRDMVSNISGSRRNGPAVKGSASQQGQQEGHKQMPFWQGSFNFLGAPPPFA
jgi:hypothetical protein